MMSVGRMSWDDSCTDGGRRKGLHIRECILLSFAGIVECGPLTNHSGSLISR
jgi:hypothetical protein